MAAGSVVPVSDFCALSICASILAESSRKPHVVLIAEGIVLACRQLRARFALLDERKEVLLGPAEARFCAGNNKAGVVLRVALENRVGFVCRAIILGDAHPVLQRLGNKRIEELGQVFLPVVCRKHYGKRAHAAPSFQARQFS